MSTRSMCSILSDMRVADERKNYSYLNSLIEEAQYAANRMERAIGDVKEIEKQRNHLGELKDACVALYDTYLAKCKELDKEPLPRDGWFGDSFERVERKYWEPEPFFRKKEEE